MHESSPMRKRTDGSPGWPCTVTSSQKRPRTIARSTASLATGLRDATDATSMTCSQRDNADRPTSRIACGIDVTLRSPYHAELTIRSSVYDSDGCELKASPSRLSLMRGSSSRARILRIVTWFAAIAWPSSVSGRLKTYPWNSEQPSCW